MYFRFFILKIKVKTDPRGDEDGCCFGRKNLIVDVVGMHIKATDIDLRQLRFDSFHALASS